MLLKTTFMVEHWGMKQFDKTAFQMFPKMVSITVNKPHSTTQSKCPFNTGKHITVLLDSWLQPPLKTGKSVSPSNLTEVVSLTILSFTPSKDQFLRHECQHMIRSTGYVGHLVPYHGLYDLRLYGITGKNTLWS